MVGSFVRFLLFTRCEGSLNSLVHIKSYALTNHEVISITVHDSVYWQFVPFLKLRLSTK